MKTAHTFTGPINPNLLNGSRFQIDGNLGGGAAIPEMLLQSHLRSIDPEDVDIQWKDGKLLQATIHVRRDGEFRIYDQGKLSEVISLAQGQSKVWPPEG